MHCWSLMNQCACKASQQKATFCDVRTFYAHILRIFGPKSKAPLDPYSDDIESYNTQRVSALQLGLIVVPSG